MSLKAGIVGMPNVGKSTLFNAIANANVEAANYPFATIKPNTGVVAVPDSRLDFLSAKFKPKKTVAATFEFYDIAGLVKGASKGEGLGNQFLAHIRECDAIVEVVRCFENSEIIHVENSVDPKRDIEIINLELILADLETLTKRYEKVVSKARVNKEPDAVIEVILLDILKAGLHNEIPARLIPLTPEQKIFANREYHLITLKPLIYVANVSEEDYADPKVNKHIGTVEAIAKKENAGLIPVSCEIESQISKLPKEEQKEFLASLGAKESGLDKLVRATYKLLNLGTFFTVGEDECRAWTFIHGMKAPQCAGIIHSDFERGFIKAEVYHYEDFVKLGSELAVKEAGKLRIEGKEYIAKDGDCMFFKFNV